MAHLTPEFALDLESRVSRKVAEEYNRLNKYLWWTKLARRESSMTQRELRWWLLSTAMIQTVDKNGSQVNFDELSTVQDEFEQEAHTSGLELFRRQFEDLDGNGLNLASEWASQTGAFAAYWPQRQVARAILANGNAYDGEAFFSSAHPYDPNDVSKGTYDNDLICDISASDRLTEFYEVKAEIAGWKMPNGETPRFLRVGALFVPPALYQDAVELCNAKFISTGSGSKDVEALVSRLGVGEPVQCDELGSAIPGNSDDDETFYIGLENVIGDPLGALVYSEREAFSTTMVTGTTSAELLRENKLQWVVRGRNKVAYGHPYLLVRCRLS